MSYEPFHERFQEIAMKETRSITIHNNPELPDDDYGFLEAYCNDEICDCRRVIFNVLSRKRGEVLAVIAYGWEDSAYYVRWYRQNDPSIIRELQGPILNLASKQSELAPALLKLVRDTLLEGSGLHRTVETPLPDVQREGGPETLQSFGHIGTTQ